MRNIQFRTLHRRCVMRPCLLALLAIAASWGGSMQEAYAANECGVVAAGATITCDGDGTPATDIDPYANGILYNIGGITLNVNDAANVISSGANKGIDIRGSDANDIIINTSDGTPVGITTTGNGAAGIYSIQSGLGAHHVTSAGVTTTSGNNSYGVYTGTWQAANTEALSVNLAGGTVSTIGDRAYGLYSVSSGLGSVDVTSSGDIETYQISYGMFGHALNSVNTSTLNMALSGGSITTNGFFGRGIYGRHDGLGSINITSNGDITTHGSNAFAIFAWSGNTLSTGSINVDVTGGSINTTNDYGHAVFGQSGGTHDVNLTSNGVITTSGTYATGLLANTDNATSTGTLTIDMTGGSINTGGVDSYGLYGYHRGLGAVNVTSSGAINTLGDDAYGIYGRVNNASNSSQITIIQNAGSAITESGGGAHGIFGHHIGLGGVNITMNASVSGGSGLGAGIGIETAGTAANAITLGAGSSLGALSDGLYQIHQRVLAA